MSEAKIASSASWLELYNNTSSAIASSGLTSAITTASVTCAKSLAGVSIDPRETKRICDSTADMVGIISDVALIEVLNKGLPIGSSNILFSLFSLNTKSSVYTTQLPLAKEDINILIGSIRGPYTIKSCEILSPCDDTQWFRVEYRFTVPT
jgi:hypothetical protein